MLFNIQHPEILRITESKFVTSQQEGVKFTCILQYNFYLTCFLNLELTKKWQVTTPC